MHAAGGGEFGEDEPSHVDPVADARQFATQGHARMYPGDTRGAALAGAAEVNGIQGQYAQRNPGQAMPVFRQPLADTRTVLPQVAQQRADPAFIRAQLARNAAARGVGTDHVIADRPQYDANGNLITPAPARGYQPGLVRQRWAQFMRRMFPHLATGGTVGLPTSSADNYYGTDTTTPTFTYNKYTPEQLGAMPFIQKLFHGAPVTPFQGFGQPISNPQIGVSNVPAMLNLQRYSGLNPTEQDMTQSLYEQGLGLDMRDIMARSAKAAPGVFGFSGATAYG